MPVPRFRTARVSVRVPATSANLGPGFDSYGLALALYDEVSAQVTEAGVRVDVSGEGSAALPRDESNLVAASLLAAFDRLGGRPPGLALRCRNGIPQARGLGSSSAAIVAGISLATALTDGPALDVDATLALATALEGHPDNVAACLFGGFTISWLDGGVAACARLEPAAGIRPVAFVPRDAALATPLARSMLPPEVPHADAAANAARAGLLTVALTSRPELLWSATEDLLHQRYRRAAMPDSLDLLARLRGSGIAAVVSGSGPSLLAFTDSASERAVAAAAPPGWTARTLSVDRAGATVAAQGTTPPRASAD